MLRYSILLLIIASLVQGCSNSEQTPADIRLAQWQEQAEAVTIFRDDYGIPHVYGKTDENAVFGMIYAQCEDDFNRVERNYLFATGRLAEAMGEEYIYSDLRARLYMTRNEAIEMYENSPPELKSLCMAWADGINYYLHTHPEVKPQLLTHFEPWMPMYFSEGSIGGDIERISLREMRAFYEQTPEHMLSLESSSLEFPEEPVGSNGIAIAPELSATGNAMLLINPHTSFFFRGEIHMASEEGLNAYGAVTWGQFFIYQGFNTNTGWMHTSTRADCIDEFVETIVQQNDQLYYEYGDELRRLEESEVTLKYREGDSLKTRTFPMYHTLHGPIVRGSGNQWVATRIMWKPVEALTQSYGRMKTTGYDSFHDIMKIRTNSSNNTVYADSEGNIAYYHGNFHPRRDTTFDYSEPVNGSNPAATWQGLHPVSECITLLNPENNWIQNCNSTPFTAAAEYSPNRENYPVYMAMDAENFRGVQAVRVLEEQQEISLESLIDLAYDPRLTGFEALIPGLVSAFDESATQQQKENLGPAIDTLRKWNYTVAGNSSAMSLAVYYGLETYRNSSFPEGLTRMEKLVFAGNDSPNEERLALFSASLSKLEEDFGNWNTPWTEINRYQRLNGDIRQDFNDDKPSVGVPMASARWGALAAFNSRQYPGTNRFYGTSGNSFVAAVEFGDSIRAKALLAGGQSGNPESPHFNDQVDIYVNAQFRDVAYYRSDVESRADEQYKPGKRK
jgi:acyl-homoserine-lactone acylase